jgi:hypothetical protein
LGSFFDNIASANRRIIWERLAMKKHIVIKKKTLIIAGILLTFVLLSSVIGSLIGYQVGVQIPQEQLIGDVKVQELANINAIIYGVGGLFLSIIGSVIYLAIVSSRKAK